MYSVHREWRPNLPLVIIASQKAQSVRCPNVTDTWTDLGTKYLCSGESTLIDSESHPSTVVVITTTSIYCIIVPWSFQIFLQHFNCFLFLHAFCAILTPKIKPVKPEFLPTHKPQFSGLKKGGVPRCFRVHGLHSLTAWCFLPTHQNISVTRIIGRLHCPGEIHQIWKK